jgi:septum formation protein
MDATDTSRLTLILASASPRRRLLLERMGLAFEVRAASITENEATDAEPAGLVRENARAKARAIAAGFPGCLVLGADTTVALDGELLHKPADLDEARVMLKRLSGRTHLVHTGVCLILAAEGFEEASVVRSQVRFHPLSDERIDAYFALVDPLDKAGAYGIQEGRELIVAGHEGSFANIMGLPVEHLRVRLRECGFWNRLSHETSG